MLKKYKLEDVKPVSTPADPNVTLQKDDGISKAMNLIVYQWIIGCLLYAAVGTRTDIFQTVGVASKVSSKPAEVHLTAVKQIYRYLKGSLEITLKYKSEYAQLIGYSDADLAGDLDDRHSTTGHMFLMNGGPVSWFSKKQSIVTLSTAEAQYVALSTVAEEATWIRRLLSDFHVTLEQATIMMEHNQAAICIARNLVTHTASPSTHTKLPIHFKGHASENT